MSILKGSLSNKDDESLPLNVTRPSWTKWISYLQLVSSERFTTLTSWLANVILVKKANGKWRMCVDFINLNSACPKDSFPLPKIDQLVNSTARHKLLTFMDAFLGITKSKCQKKTKRKLPSSPIKVFISIK